jgi:hypothetical protein
MTWLSTKQLESINSSLLTHTRWQLVLLGCVNCLCCIIGPLGVGWSRC